MNSKAYWGKIGFKALGIFAIGFAGISIFRSTKRQVVSAVETNADLTIPLPFVPFNFDGTKLGTFRKVVFHRSTPEHVESVDVSVRLTDPAAVEQFSVCSHLTVDDPTRLNEHSSFRCATLDDTNQAFGSVHLYVRQDGGWNQASSVPLVLPKDVAAKMRGQNAQMNASQLEADRMRQLGDSMGVLARQFAAAKTDEARQATKEQMEALESEMQDLRESIVETAQERASAAAEVTVKTVIKGGDAAVVVTKPVVPTAEAVPEAPKAPKPPR